jgi:hypothetical protein
MSERSQVSKEPVPLPQALPPELQGKTLPPAEGATAEAREAVVAQDAARPAVADVGAAAAFGSDLHAYVREYIALADQKAAVLFTVVAGMLAYLQTQNAARRWMVDPRTWGILELLSFAAMVGLLCGSIGALSVVVPRTRGSKRGLVFWGAVALHRDAQEYADRVVRMDGPALVRAKLEHSHELAVICRRKYRALDKAIWCAAVGLVAALIYIAVS